MASAYPNQPGARKVDTSQDAASAIAPHASRLQAKVLDTLRKHGALATFEIAAKSGVSYRSIQPRTAELRRQGYISDSGKRAVDPETQRSAIVWQIA